MTIRINSCEEARSERGWEQSMIDELPTEIELDHFDQWNFSLNNNDKGGENI